MNAILKTPTSTIVAPGAGAELEDRWAAKLVDQWLGVLAAHSDKVTEEGFKNLTRIGGNKVAQERFFQRLRAGYGDVLLDATLFSGNRAKFEIITDIWGIGPSVQAIVNTPNAAARDDLPKQWIYVGRRVMRREGLRSEPFHDTFVVAAVSKHAVVRLVQRGGCHDVAGLAKSLRSAWFRLSIFCGLLDHKNITSDDYLVPIRLPGLDEPRVALLSPVEEQGNEITLVKTILTLDMLTVEQRAALMTLDLLLVGVRNLSDFIASKSDIGEVISAMQNCRQ